MSQKTKKKFKVGAAIAGGGPEGAVYEIGALRAIEDAVDGLNFNDCHAYVGISAGAFLASNLANDMTTGQMARAIVSTDPGEHPFVPEMFLTPAIGEFIRSGLKVPYFLIEAAKDYLKNTQDHTVVKSLTRLSRALPVGLFDNNPIRDYLEKIYSIKGRTNDFRKLDKHLFVVAADLDSGEAVLFGKEGLDHVPISTAVQASTALPGLYPPVLIDGRYYVDGVLLKTLHASTILETGVDLAICVNPIVPVDTRTSVEQGYMKRGKLVDKGMPSVVSQMFRTLIHSRMQLGMSSYDHKYEDIDIVLFEPSKEDYRMFFTNIFSFSSRKAVCEHAYRATLLDLGRRREELGPVFERHGLKLNEYVLDHPEHNVWESVELYKRRPSHRNPISTQLDHALHRLERLLDRRATAV